MTDREAMNMALEALEDMAEFSPSRLEHQITTLRQALAQPEQVIDGNTSDGYHTFNELYDFRKAYNAALFNEWAAIGKYSVHKSKRHFDGEVCFGGGWFIVVAQLPDGQISNHYEMKDWDKFQVPETDKALFEYDNHTGEDVLHRLFSLCSLAQPEQEPVAWLHPDKKVDVVVPSNLAWFDKPLPLYTAPPSKPDTRLKVKLGRQYGGDLNGHWFYLQPADEYAELALTKHSGISAPPSKPCAITDMVQQKFQSGNNVPVERITITRSEYEAALKEQE